MIPFSPPRIDQHTIAAVTAVLQSGWITTGPKVRELENEINRYCGSSRTICLNSWTNAAELVLRWLGCGRSVKDEVVLPAYTYAATANIVVHCGARPVLIDSSDGEFAPEAYQYERATNSRTKALIPVDIGGMPCHYNELMQVAQNARKFFSPAGQVQEELSRPLVLSDSAHSFGARYQNEMAGHVCDVHGFSFHAVKNLTTAEGGALTLNLPRPLDNDLLWQWLNRMALHGQTKDALSKSKAGQWEYDIADAGFKCNMTDIHAAIGLVEMGRYESETLPRRKAICEAYHRAFQEKEWYKAPTLKTTWGESSYHLFMLRVKGISEAQRNRIIEAIAAQQVAVNVHFKPVHMMSYYVRTFGFRLEDFPNAYAHYASEISLPVYYDLSDEQVNVVIGAVTTAVEKNLG